MSLDKYLCQVISPILPIKVIGSGRGLSNVPKGAIGFVLSISDTHYQIQWDTNNIKEKLLKFGSVFLDLDIYENLA